MWMHNGGIAEFNKVTVALFLCFAFHLSSTNLTISIVLADQASPPEFVA